MLEYRDPQGTLEKKRHRGKEGKKKGKKKKKKKRRKRIKLKLCEISQTFWPHSGRKLEADREVEMMMCRERGVPPGCSGPRPPVCFDGG